MGVPRDDVSSPVDDVQKKIRHAERFGVSVKLTEEEKRNSRAEMLKAIGDVGPAVDAGGIIAYARKAGMIPSAAA
ncbi:hypothetical protein F2Q68_00040372 [Brassica cretica]|uniref:THO1-MOS11 C-terminal domain-containing protein n=1 Tax=Brassica cretica TaxID=69181 RepID=A0A8S9MI68_BRACR|nr:hypothetical protein F2Q68_00040372 [Brassica cretica]